MLAMKVSIITWLVVVIVLATIDFSASHGTFTTPKAKFKPNVMTTSYVELIDANSVFEGEFNDSPERNADTFNKAFAASKKYKTLRDLLDKYGPECGNTVMDNDLQPIPKENEIVWQNLDTGDGFTPSHSGPCEVFINDERVFQNDNCAAKFSSKPAAHIPIDYTKCTGEKCVLRFYWIALHEPKWQVYKNCVALKGNGKPSDNKTKEPSNDNKTKEPSNNNKTEEPSNDNKTKEPTKIPITNIPSSNNSTMKCKKINGKNIDKHDLFDFQMYSSSSNNSSSQCQTACSKMKDCVGFTIADNICYLKDKIDTLSADESTTSFNCRVSSNYTKKDTNDSKFDRDDRSIEDEYDYSKRL